MSLHKPHKYPVAFPKCRIDRNFSKIDSQASPAYLDHSVQAIFSQPASTSCDLAHRNHENTPSGCLSLDTGKPRSHPPILEHEPQASRLFIQASGTTSSRFSSQLAFPLISLTQIQPPLDVLIHVLQAQKGGINQCPREHTALKANSSAVSGWAREGIPSAMTPVISPSAYFSSACEEGLGGQGPPASLGDPVPCPWGREVGLC